ncbi:hypothetical protein FACS1894142_3030 [Spirochaetia bacterium]|nr:hypothetical protein FACS1894142_3030 [Spirochaetia bacterium]
MIYKRVLPVLILTILGLSPLFGQDLSIGPEDLRIEQRVDGGFHLFIRKKPDIRSVLLVESTRDPQMQVDNYAFRAAEWNAVNGNEIRVLDGYVIPPENNVRSIIDSTPEPDPDFGQAFHLYLPNILLYGYENTRNGEVYVTDGTYFNLRAFALPYADYRSSFQDNPFVMQVTQQPLAGPAAGNYMQDTIDSFNDITNGRGYTVYSTGPDDLVDKMGEMLAKEDGNDVDLVICLDTTGSMKDDIDSLRERLVPMLEDAITGFQGFRIGMVLYKDYNDSYLTQLIPFTEDFEQFQKTLNNIRVGGGRDIPEAVHEALYDGATQFPWEAESKLMVLIGDAPPHPRPRGTITKEMVDQAVIERDIKVNAIILPQ